VQILILRALAQIQVFAQQGEVLKCLSDFEPELIQTERLRDVVESACRDRIHHGIHRSECRHDDKHGFGPGGFEAPHDLKTIDSLHSEVRKDHLEGLLLAQPQSFFAVVSQGHRVAFSCHGFAQGGESRRIVVDNQDSRLECHGFCLSALILAAILTCATPAGSRTKKVVPAPGVLVKSMLPPY